MKLSAGKGRSLRLQQILKAPEHNLRHKCATMDRKLKETLENPAILRENGTVIAGADWLHGDQAVRFW
jgi:hypothetical protein